MPSPSRYEQVEEMWERRYEQREYYGESWLDREIRENGGKLCGEASSSEEEVAAAAGAGAEATPPTCTVCINPCACHGGHRISCIPCGHVYGRSCLLKWLTKCEKSWDQSATCPQCGEWFEQEDIINLYAQDVAIYAQDRISCFPCGHVYGRSRLEKWLTQRRNQSVKCRQCGKRFEQKEIINLYAQGVAIPNSQLEKKVAEHSYEAANLEPCLPATKTFSLQNELSVDLDGVRVISIDASNQIILVSGRATAIGAEYVLTKISMQSNHEVRKIHLPPDTKAVMDMCILPCGSAIFTSLGRKLSLFSMTTDSIALSWDLPAPGWSCAVGPSGSHHIYTGLQNGMVMVFDIRQTARPLHSMVGLSTNPVHTLHSVINNNGSRKVLSASAVGPCMWDADNNQSRPHLLNSMQDEMVCISLACVSPSSDCMVASFLPKRSGSGISGYHALIRRTDKHPLLKGITRYANVGKLHMLKSAVIPYGDNKHLFAFGDESLHGVRTWQLPWFQTHADLCTHPEPILDLRYAETGSGGGVKYLGCLSEEKLQVFRVN